MYSNNSKNKKTYWLPPKGFGEFFLASSDDAYKEKHPIKYGFIVALGITALVGPMILYFILLECMGVSSDVPVGLGFIGAFIIGIGLFNLVAIILNQYLGHLVSIISFLMGGILLIINLGRL